VTVSAAGLLNCFSAVGSIERQFGIFRMVRDTCQPVISSRTGGHLSNPIRRPQQWSHIMFGLILAVLAVLFQQALGWPFADLALGLM